VERLQLHIPLILRVRISQLSESPLDINLISSYSFCCFQLGHDVAPVDWGNRPHCSHISSPGVNEVSHKNGHILPTGQWYAPSAVINVAKM